MSNDTPRTSEALGATLEAGWDLGPQHRALTELCRELERENTMLRQGDTCARQCEGTAYRIEARRLRGERAVFAELFDAAARVIHTIDGDDTDEESQLRGLQERLERAALEARGVTANVDVTGARRASVLMALLGLLERNEHGCTDKPLHEPANRRGDAVYYRPPDKREGWRG